MEKGDVRLTDLVRSSGCNAKLPPGDLDSVLRSLPSFPDPAILAGYETADDAFVYDLGDGRAMLQTVDFFPPMVDDPQLFGEIAAANAISDIYAMGGEPRLALNVMCVPEKLPGEAVRAILFTCSQFPGVKKVEVQVEGEKIEAQPETATTFINAEEEVIAQYPGVVELD